MGHAAWGKIKKAASHSQPFCIASLAFPLRDLKELHGLRFRAAKLKREYRRYGQRAVMLVTL
jgi:hypothetical protein